MSEELCLELAVKSKEGTQGPLSDCQLLRPLLLLCNPGPGVSGHWGPSCGDQAEVHLGLSHLLPGQCQSTLSCLVKWDVMTTHSPGAGPGAGRLTDTSSFTSGLQSTGTRARQGERDRTSFCWHPWGNVLVSRCRPSTGTWAVGGSGNGHPGAAHIQGKSNCMCVCGRDTFQNRS